LLGEAASDLPSASIDQIRDELYVLADVAVEAFLEVGKRLDEFGPMVNPEIDLEAFADATGWDLRFPDEY
jgi:hypothetical protein